MKNKQEGFSLVEVLTVVGIVAVLALVVVYALNPSQFFAQGNDANRVAAIGTLDKSVSLYYSNAMNTPSTLFMGTSSVVYVSIPDPTATTTAGTNCAGLGFVSIGSTTYHCAAPSNYLNVDGTGWVPINFTSYPGGSPMSSLPKDPINTTSSGEYLVYTTNGTGGYEIMGAPQSTKYASSTADFVRGTSLALLSSFPGTGGSGGATKTCNSGTWNCAANNVCADTLGDGSYVVVANTDLAGGYAWNSGTTCNQPQCQVNGPINGNNLVADNTVNFSGYPARVACQALGGRLPTLTELTCIYNNQSSFGSNFNTHELYWSSAEYSAGGAYVVNFINGSNGKDSKTNGDQVRCVFGW